MLSELLAKKFKMSRFENVKELTKITQGTVADFTVYKTVKNGVEPSIVTFILIAYYLDFTPKEIADACELAGDKVLHKLIAPVGVDVEDRAIIDILAKIPQEKKQLAIELLKQFGG